MSIIEKTEENSRHDHYADEGEARISSTAMVTLKMQFGVNEIVFNHGSGYGNHKAELIIDTRTTMEVQLSGNGTPIFATLLLQGSPKIIKRYYPLVVRLLVDYRKHPLTTDNDAIMKTLLIFLDVMKLRATRKVWRVSNSSGDVIGYYLLKETGELSIKYGIKQHEEEIYGSPSTDDDYVLELVNMPKETPILHGVVRW